MLEVPDQDGIMPVPRLIRFRRSVPLPKQAFYQIELYTHRQYNL